MENVISALQRIVDVLELFSCLFRNQLEIGSVSQRGADDLVVCASGKEAALTIKGESAGAARDEYEYPIPKEDAEQMLQKLCVKPQIKKPGHVRLRRASGAT
jgi:CYTH domain-containing protein